MRGWSRGGRHWLPLLVVLRLRTRDGPLLGRPCLADARLLLYLDLSSWNPRIVNVLPNSLLHATPLRDADVVGPVPFRLDPIDDRLVVWKLGGTTCVERNCLCWHFFVSSDSRRRFPFGQTETPTVIFNFSSFATEALARAPYALSDP